MSEELSPETIQAVQGSMLYYGKEMFRQRYVQDPIYEYTHRTRAAIGVNVTQYGVSLGEGYREALNLYLSSYSDLRYQSATRYPIEDVMLAGVSNYIGTPANGIGFTDMRRFTDAEAEAIITEIRAKAHLPGEQTITFSLEGFNNGNPINVPLKESFRYLAGYDDGDVMTQIASTCRNPAELAPRSQKDKDLCTTLEKRLAIAADTVQQCGNAIRDAAITEVDARPTEATFYVGVYDGARNKVTPKTLAEVGASPIVTDARNCTSSAVSAPSIPRTINSDSVATENTPQR